MKIPDSPGKGGHLQSSRCYLNGASCIKAIQGEFPRGTGDILKGPQDRTGSACI